MQRDRDAERQKQIHVGRDAERQGSRETGMQNYYGFLRSIRRVTRFYLCSSSSLSASPPFCQIQRHKERERETEAETETDRHIEKKR